MKSESCVSLADRTVLVIGPPTSLTASIARAARDCGALVAMASPDAVAGIAARPDFHAGTGSDADVEVFLDAVIEPLPRLDTAIIVVTTPGPGCLHETPMARWREHVTHPLRTVFRLTRRLTEEFLASGGSGRIVVVAVAGEDGEPNDVVEGGLRSLARSFAREYGRRELACNVVLSARSELSKDGRVPDTHLTPGRATDDGRVQAALFLASPAASFVNGETLVVDPAAEPGQAR